MTGSHHPCLAKGRSDLLYGLLLILRGRLGAGGAVDANHAVLADSVLIQNARNTASLPHCINELRALFDRSHRTVTNRARPDRRNKRANGKTLGGDLVSQSPDISFTCIRINMRMKEKEIDSVKLLPVN